VAPRGVDGGLRCVSLLARLSETAVRAVALAAGLPNWGWVDEWGDDQEPLYTGFLGDVSWDEGEAPRLRASAEAAVEPEAAAAALCE
jgi:hypothetical protein